MEEGGPDEVAGGSVGVLGAGTDAGGGVRFDALHGEGDGVEKVTWDAGIEVEGVEDGDGFGAVKVKSNPTRRSALSRGVSLSPSGVRFLVRAKKSAFWTGPCRPRRSAVFPLESVVMLRRNLWRSNRLW